MANIYRGQLDAFERYHQYDEVESTRNDSTAIPPTLPPLGHAVSGATGSAISNLITYPLALTVTRLQVQRQTKRSADGSDVNHYDSVQDAIVKIVDSHGVAGLFQGLEAATVKTVCDSFLFFLTYNSLRKSRIYRAAPGRSSAAEELKIGFVAGAFGKFLTTPIANVVTRKQLSAVGGSAGSGSETASLVRSIYHERGVRGFWSGYSASLILTLNPSLTFCFFDILKKLLLPREARAKPSARAIFFLSALSKAMASTITYPISLAKTRLQIQKSQSDKSCDRSGHMPQARSGLFSIIMQIVRSEGYSSLYDGVIAEVAKGFLSHGITMLMKDAIQKAILRMYFLILKVLRRHRLPKLATDVAMQAVQGTTVKFQGG